MKENQDFFNVLFNENEHVCFARRIYDTQTQPVSDYRTLNETYQFYTINPLKKDKTRKAANVSAYRNFLFESDTIPNPKDQIRLIKQSGFPYSALVYSGGKSVHFPLALETKVEDRIVYDAIWKACQAGLSKHGLEVDKATKDPCRFSRLPGAIRQDNNKEQKLIEVTRKIRLSVLEDWLKDNGIQWQDYLPKQEFKPAFISSDFSSVSDNEKWDWILKYYMKDDVFSDGNRHSYQVKMMLPLLRTGMTKESIIRFFDAKLGIVSTSLTWPTEMPSGGPIFVPSKQDRIDYYRRLEQQSAFEARASVNTPEIEKEQADHNVRTENIDRYLRVGVKYYKIDSISDKLITWDKSTFEKDYGTYSIPPLRYDEFTYKPDYISESFPYSLGEGNNKRNSFVRPTYKMTQGNWKTIEGALRHAYGDLYDIIIQYCAVLLRYPDQPLPVLWFVGPEGKGKSAIIKIFQLLVGDRNVRPVPSKMFENEFNGWLKDAMLVVCEEAGGWKDPKAVDNNIKGWCTIKGEQLLNPKYGVQEMYPIFAKFIMSTNNYEDIVLQGDATRVWITEITSLPPKVINYYGKIESEIGHFAHHLLSIDLIPEKQIVERLYFSTEQYVTDVKKFLKDASNSILYETIKNILSDFFEKHKDEKTVFFDLKSITSILIKSRKFRDIEAKEIKMCLKKEFKKDPSNSLTRPDSLSFQDILGDLETEKPSRRSHWFIFERSEVLGENAIFEELGFSY